MASETVQERNKRMGWGCECHGETFCPDLVCAGYEDDIPIFVRRDSDEGRAILAAQKAPAPERWQLVPVEPTEEMLQAFSEGYHDREQAGDVTHECRLADAWAAMLAAAPAPAPEPAPQAVGLDVIERIAIAMRGGLLTWNACGNDYKEMMRAKAATALSPQPKERP